MEERAGLLAGRPNRGRGEKAAGSIWTERDRREEDHEILKFLSYFWGPIPWMIEAAVILSALAQHVELNSGEWPAGVLVADGSLDRPGWRRGVIESACVEDGSFGCLWSH